MIKLYAALGVLALLLGLGYYAKIATERAALAEAAVETLAAGYEQYEKRIEEAETATLQRDREWGVLENEYQQRLAEFEQVPATDCDRAPVATAITDRLLSAAGYDTRGGTHSADPDRTSSTPGPAPHLSNRGQSAWITGYQRQLDRCNVNLSKIRSLQEQAESPRD